MAALEVLAEALRLGCTAFGGPVAHVAHLRRAYVERLRWIDERAFTELVGICQALPGPTSSQLGIAIGIRRAGLVGGLAAWTGFTLPAALVLGGAGVLGIGAGPGSAGWVAGLKVAAFAIVLHALVALARGLGAAAAPRLLAVAVLAGGLVVPIAGAGLLLVAAAGLAALAVPALRAGPPAPPDRAPPIAATDPPTAARRGGRGGHGRPGRRRVAAVAVLGLLVAALAVAAIVEAPGEERAASSGPAGTGAFLVAVAASGALVVGGGHVVLPLLHDAVVAPGWVAPDAFLAGYGLAQAVPGPLFAVAAYLGAVASVPPGGAAGALLALLAIFLPGVLIVVAVLPLWSRLRGRARVRATLDGVRAGAVGLLGAALAGPVAAGALGDPGRVALALVATALAVVGAAPVVVVAVAGLAGALLLA